jgi:lipopolysaccharide transport system ATP-binding protein
MATISALCPQSILLYQGEIVEYDQSELVINSYLNRFFHSSEISLAQRTDRKGTGFIRFKSLYLENEKEEKIDYFYSGQNGKIILIFEKLSNNNIKNLNLAIGIDDPSGTRIAFISNNTIGSDLFFESQDVNAVIINIHKIPLNSGRYTFTIYCEVNGELSDWIQNAGFFEVESGDYYQTGKLPPKGQGYFLLDYSLKLAHM